MRFVCLARLGDLRFGVATSWLPAQAIGLLAFAGLAYATVAGHLGISLSPLATVWIGLVLLAALNLTVLVHELGHVLATKAAGLNVQAVVLLAYGGATVRAGSTNTSANRWIAAAGPLANAAAAALGILALSVLPAQSALVPILEVGTSFQVLSAALNLLPASRCDGARIFCR